MSFIFNLEEEFLLYPAAGTPSSKSLKLDCDNRKFEEPFNPRQSKKSEVLIDKALHLLAARNISVRVSYEQKL